MTDIPEWAQERVRQMLDREEVRSLHEPAKETIGRAFARYIAEHEEPPVDPLLIEARKLLAEDHRNGLIALAHPWGSCILKPGAGEDLILEGKYDHSRKVSQYIAALKRGMELAREAKP